MDSINFQLYYSRNTLIRMLIAALAVAALLLANWELINEFYFQDQLTKLGWVINGAIVAIFALGLLRLAANLMAFSKEEHALVTFAKNIVKDPENPLKGLPAKSLIARRFNTIVALSEGNNPIHQNALASTLVASESTRNSLPKFINNILILMGVFGTIVSLSIALLGASDALESTVNQGGMSMVIHGMSTALSTTITAILCYLYFGYFYLRTTDAQTNLISGVEEITTVHLMPKYQVQTDSALYEFTGLIRSLQGLVMDMRQSQESFADAEKQMVSTLDYYRDKMDGMDKYLAKISQQLRHGFRLRDEE